MALITIAPNTTGLISHTVTDTAGTPITDAVVVADVFSPASTLISGDIDLPHIGSGVYTMVVEPEWSVDVESLPVEGKYFALITIDTAAGDRETVKYEWRCKFT